MKGMASSGCWDLGIIKLEFVEKTQFSSMCVRPKLE